MRLAWMTVVAFAVAGIGGVSAAGAATPTQNWTAGVAVGLPADAHAMPDGQLNAISCPLAGDCTAVGVYLNQTGRAPMATTQTGGAAYPTATELALPSRAGAAIDGATLYGVSCTSPGNCVAVGNDQASSGAGAPITASETGGSWSQPAEMSLPTGASNGSAGLLYGVSCWSPGDCVAVGDYTGSGGDPQGLVETRIQGGGWQASELTGPAAGSTGVTLESVSCTADGSCTVGGADHTAGGGSLPLVADVVDGSLADAHTLSLPDDASTGGADSVNSISCPSDGACTAVGGYVSATSPPSLAWSETGGSFGAPVALALPPDAGSGPSLYDDVSCAAPGDCSAIGTYEDGTGRQTFGATDSGGSWSPAMRLTEPAGAVDTGNGPYVDAISCTSVEVCGVAGAYATNAGGDTAPMTLASYPDPPVTTASPPPATVGDAASTTPATAVPGAPAAPAASGNPPAAVGSPPPAMGTAHLERVAAGDAMITTTIACAGAETQTCAGALDAVVSERVRGGEIVGDGPRVRTRIRVVIVGRTRFSVHGGARVVVRIPLTRTGRALLAHHAKLRVAIAAIASGSSHRTVLATVTVHRPTSHRRRDRRRT